RPSDKEALHRWVFLLARAHAYTAVELRDLLPGKDFSRATTTISNISEITTDKLMYDSREKAQRDYEWAMSSMREKSREEGREESRQSSIRTINMLQDILLLPPIPEADAAVMTIEELEEQQTSLARQIRQRTSENREE
ncbi:MAG: hypothetical protein AAFP69_17720, partial [Planctomycetota bacterium]